MRRLFPALAFVLLASPVAAQPSDIPPEIDKVLVCSTVLSLHGEDLRASGDEAGATEWSFRSTELEERAALMLADGGMAAADIDNVLMNYALVVGFEVGAGAARFTFEDCLALIE